MKGESKFCKFYLFGFNGKDSLQPKFLSPRQMCCDLLFQSFCSYQVLKKQIEKNAFIKLFVTVVIERKLYYIGHQNSCKSYGVNLNC